MKKDKDLPEILSREEIAQLLDHCANPKHKAICEASHKTDVLAALTVLKLKKKYPDIKLILVLLCLTQTRGWPAADVKEYERIKAQADKVVYTSQEYTKGCMHKRNRHLVDNSSVCICFCIKDTGGTAYTVSCARKKGLGIVNLAR